LLESCELGCDLPIERCGKSVEIAGKFLEQRRGEGFEKTRKILRKSPISGQVFSKNRAIPHPIGDIPWGDPAVPGETGG
jgi:hypothetical protein